MTTPPATIGRYEIVKPIGQGGMGTLYLAFDPALDRQIAIKVLRDDDPDLRERFSREARSAARLRHPHIVTIYDVGDHNGQPFIAMEFIQGMTLAVIVKNGHPMPTLRKVELMEELCDGLAYAHRAGIVHRDIKPANLIVSSDGPLKILDFGIARLTQSAGMTQAGQVMGTLNYMSPEQMMGRPVDHRSDIFAVGAVSYELLSYRQAFPGGIGDGVYHKILTESPPSLTETMPFLDSELVSIVSRALEKEPSQRYQDLVAMRSDLHRLRMRLREPDDATQTISAAAETTMGSPIPRLSSSPIGVTLPPSGWRAPETGTPPPTPQRGEPTLPTPRTGPAPWVAPSEAARQAPHIETVPPTVVAKKDNPATRKPYGIGTIVSFVGVGGLAAGFVFWILANILRPVGAPPPIATGAPAPPPVVEKEKAKDAPVTTTPNAGAPAGAEQIPATPPPPPPTATPPPREVPTVGPRSGRPETKGAALKPVVREPPPPTRAQCASVLQRQQIGEPLTEDEQAILKRCK